MASDLARFSVTMPTDLLELLDAYVARRGTNTNRSEVLRDLVRERLVEETLEVPDGEVVGSITMIYDHHTPGLSARLAKIQHRHTSEIVSSMHVHLNHDDCLEIIAVRGQGRIVANMADCMLGLKGVRHGKLTCVAASEESSGSDDHPHGHDMGHGEH